MYKLARITIIALVVFVSACATAIPTSSRISDTMMMGIKQGPVKAVAFEFNSAVQDGEIQPVGKDSREVPPMSPTYVHTENSTLDKMLKDYMNMKFPAVDAAAPTKMKVTLKDFWIEQYNTASAGKQLMVGLVGGEMNIAVVAHLTVVFEFSNGGSPITKNVMIESDSTHVQGVGTYSSTSSYYRGRESIEFRVAEAINGANNKAIALLNQFIDSQIQ